MKTYPDAPIKVLVEIEGGLVNSVTASDHRVQLVRIDYDTEGCDTEGCDTETDECLYDLVTDCNGHEVTQTVYATEFSVEDSWTTDDQAVALAESILAANGNRQGLITPGDMIIECSEREHAIILAALHHYSASFQADEIDKCLPPSSFEVEDIANDGGKHPWPYDNLNYDEREAACNEVVEFIDSMADSLNGEGKQFDAE